MLRQKKSEVRSQKSVGLFVFAVFCFLFSVFCLLGCGYSFVQSDRSFSVDIFDNETERRGHEFALTQRLIQAMKERGITVSNNAPYKIRGKILKINQDVLAVSRKDEVIAGSLEFFVDYEVIEKRTGKQILKNSTNYKSAFSQDRNKGEASALSEVFQRIGDTIAIELTEL
ncbi:MAG: hypothetical protein HY606_09980 [Planctomycetes bacterium]|nr:hypothetical protein [Planctomycetota bacterium]